MCEDFSAIVLYSPRDKDFQVYWYEEDSHSEISRRLHDHKIVKGSERENKNIVAIECRPPYKVVRLDAPRDEPKWYIHNKAKIAVAIRRIAKRRAGQRDAYDADLKPLDDKYYADLKTLADKYYADLKPLDDKYYADRKTLADKYYADRKTLADKYNADRKTLDDKYDADRKPLDDKYIGKLARIAGYLPVK